MQRMTRLGLATAVTAMTVAATAAPAAAFCGFYIDTGGAKLTNDATQVVLMRKGTRSSREARPSRRPTAAGTSC